MAYSTFYIVVGRYIHLLMLCYNVMGVETQYWSLVYRQTKRY